MTDDARESDTAVLWMEDEPERLERDRREVEHFAPDLTYVEPRTDGFLHGGWIGRLPLWPFDRPEPEGLRELLGDAGAEVAVVFSAAHPMIAPTVYPIRPEPAIEERTQAIWHVAPDGSLCLLQNQGQWRPEASVTDLLLKAAGWLVEYALMKAEAIDKMTECGIVTDDSLDGLVLPSVQRIAREVEYDSHDEDAEEAHDGSHSG